MLITLLAISTTQQTCDPAYYKSPDGRQHLYESQPTKDKQDLYCIVHDVVETVYRLTPDIQDVEGNQDIVHQVYDKLNSIDNQTFKFAHKLGNNDESEYVLKVNVATNGKSEEIVYFVLPKDKE